ncbi:MAG TPA: lipid A biosynthesis acyltransferase, partial [Pseudomonadales bacterium]|nr:lipid A biosynthesis acyltransferase [Pseudomonadales bacterium]
RNRRHIAAVNLALCFPELSDQQRKALLRETFAEAGIGLLETAFSYFGDEESILQRTHYVGTEHLAAAMRQNKGVLLIGAHYSMLDLGAILLKPYCNVVTMYRANSNPLLNEFIKQRRARFTKANYERHAMRPVLKHLKQGDVVWYAPDQDYGRKVSVFAPFFGVTAATITTTSKLAGFNRSPVLILGYHRNADDSGYTVRFEPLDVEFPSGDEVNDATLINRALEKMIRINPAQYMWVHRRFKTQPDGGKRPY